MQELKLQHAGGADELPPAWTELVTGQLATDIANAFRAWKRNGTVSLGPDPVVVWIRPFDKTVQGSVVSLRVCTDGSETRLQRPDGTIEMGRPAINYFYFKYFDGTLKAFDSDDKLVSRC